MSLPGLTFIEVERQMPLMTLPVRTSVVQLGGARVMISPASVLTEAQLRGAGEVTDLVAPSLLHAGGMKRAAEVHPNARLWGPEGIREKLPELRWHGILGVDPWPYEAELALLPLAGLPSLREVLFLHPKSKSLLITDLVFNIQDARGFGPWLILSIFGTRNRMATSRLFVKAIKDRAEFQRSVSPLGALEFENLVPSHGGIVSTEAKPRLLAALRERGLQVGA